MIQTFTEFFQFLRSPSFKVPKTDNKTKWGDFMWLFLLDILFSIPFVALYYVLVELKLIKEYEGFDIFKEYGIYWGFIIGCFFAPLLEEYLFRWQLTKRYASIYFVMLSIATMIIFGIESELISWVIFLTALAIARILHVILKKRSLTLTHNLWKKCYPVLFYVTAIIFGLIHLSNYKDLTLTDPSIVFYMGSQLFGGLILGYLRIRQGIAYSILFHACFNLIALSLELFFG